MLRFILLLFTFQIISSSLFAQHSHTHDHDSHKYHLGIGIAGTRIISENELAPGFHVHFIRQLGHHNQWGIGLGYETIIDEHWHNGFNLLAIYRRLRFLSL